jgi:uncharacterized protein GlcG (DUF336 family)
MSTTYSKKSLTAQAAIDVIEACRRKAEQLDHPFVIAVVDESGRVKASLTMDGAALISSQIATDKAYTAAGFGISTDAWHDFIKGDEPLRLGAPTGIDRLVTFGGGYPLLVDGQVVGGVGVSGGHYSQDMEVAQAGVDVLAS